ncbi:MULTISPECIES: nuclear transport factor 2 family protein [unclassified Gordonia (in: high G+C Gram-positive bacteria)]
MTQPAAVTAWHRIVESGDTGAPLDALLSDDVVFRSPAVFTPQEGRVRAASYLRAAMTVLGPTLTYHREFVSGDSAVLEFTADLDGVQVHGIDLLRWDSSDSLVEFTVMVRPLRALNTLVELMGAELQRSAS